jgi:RNA polymerase sigma-70 factor (ECF subfamily)
VKQPAADKLDLELLRRRDGGEFGRFVRCYEGFVLGLCQTLGLSSADRDDAAAETFAIAYRGLEQFRGEAELSTWLYRIACRTAMKVRRRYPAGVGIVGEMEEGREAVKDPLVSEEEARAVWSAVAALEPEQAAAVEMFYRQGMTVGEIAEVLEKPEGTVKTLLYRGREKLREQLRALAPERAMEGGT